MHISFSPSFYPFISLSSPSLSFSFSPFSPFSFSFSFPFCSSFPLQIGLLSFYRYVQCMHVYTWLAMCHTCICLGIPYGTWLAMCHSHGLPCVTHMACYVSSDTYCLKKHEILTVSGTNIVRLLRDHHSFFNVIHMEPNPIIKIYKHYIIIIKIFKLLLFFLFFFNAQTKTKL